MTLAAEECAALARAARYDEARLVATRFGFHELRPQDSASDLASDKALRAAARYMLVHSPKLVIEALDRAIPSSEQRHLPHRSVELLLLRALAHKQDGKSAAALTDLCDALCIAAPRQYRRVFLDEGSEIGSLIDRLDPDRLRDSQAAPLLRSLQQTMRKRGNHGSEGTSAMAEQLTRREVSILKRLESGLSNREIAKAIFLSEGTLKWHLHNVYSKLDVKNRAGAMTRARSLGIL
jgi:LuxR family maltose regulon positive regulatory protein